MWVFVAVWRFLWKRSVWKHEIVPGLGLTLKPFVGNPSCFKVFTSVHMFEFGCFNARSCLCVCVCVITHMCNCVSLLPLRCVKVCSSLWCLALGFIKGLGRGMISFSKCRCVCQHACVCVVSVCRPTEWMWFTLHWPPVSHRQKLASLVLMGCRTEEEGVVRMW